MRGLYQDSFNCLSDEKPCKVIEECRMNAKDFQIVKVIGRGAFGEVQLVSKSFCTFTSINDK